MQDIESLFTGIGGQFYEPPSVIQQRLASIEAYIFDWDGVFNSGHKNAEGYSSFSEGDAMGINMLRFSHFLSRNNQPKIFVVTGEVNPATEKLAVREHLHAVFYKVKHKADVLPVLREDYALEPESCAFFFDDILDLSLARLVGLRFYLARRSNPVLNEYVIQNNLCEYAAGHNGDQNGVRECCELIMSLRDNAHETIAARANFSENYVRYLEERDQTNTLFFQSKDSEIVRFKL